MSRHYKVVVIGGGIIGCSVLYNLARLGWTDSLLLERMTLTSGTTWHAAGNCTHFGHDVELTRLYTDTLDVYREAERESGQAIGFHRTGSLRLATRQEEIDGYRALEPLYRELDVPFAVVAPDEIARLHPLLSLHGVIGAAHTPDDGHVDPSGATLAMAAAARARGATIRQHMPVQEIGPCGEGGWSVSAGGERFTAEHLVLAAGFWTRELAEPLGLRLPLFALEHHEIITGDSDDVARLGVELPTIRDATIPGNIRQEGKGFLCGIYEAEPVPWAVEGVPRDFGPELLPPDLDRLLPHLERAMERLPAFGRAGIRTINNGPICYTPDGFPLLGAVRGQDGLWLAAGFHVGIGTGGGGGRYLAGLMVEGRPPHPLPCADPDRFGGDWTVEAAVAAIRHHYASGYPIPRAEAVVQGTGGAAP